LPRGQTSEALTGGILQISKEAIPSWLTDVCQWNNFEYQFINFQL